MAADEEPRLLTPSLHAPGLRIALYDAEPADREALERLLLADGHAVRACGTAADCTALLRGETFDLFVAGWAAHGTDGLDLVRQVRAGEGLPAAIPVLMLSARTSEFDAVAGLDSGADDYVFKPWRPFELIARIRALTRTHAAAGAPTVMLHGFVFDAVTQAVEGHGISAQLTAREFAVALVLFRRFGEVVTREQLLGASPACGPGSRTIDQHVVRVRNKLLKPSRAFTLQAVYGVGYVLRRLGGAP